MKKFRMWTSVEYTMEVELEAADADEAERKVKAMDPSTLMEDAVGVPQITVVDCFESES